MYGGGGGASSTGAPGRGALPLPHPSRAESSSDGTRVPDRGAPDALLGRLRRSLPSIARPRPGATRPEAVRSTGPGHVQRGKRQRLAAPVRDRPVLGRDPGRPTRHRGARARLRRLAGEARGRARVGHRRGPGAGQAARRRGRVRRPPQGHEPAGGGRARRAREPAPRRHGAAGPQGATALGPLGRDPVALQCVGHRQGRSCSARGRAAVFRRQGPEGGVRQDDRAPRRPVRPPAGPTRPCSPGAASGASTPCSAMCAA